MPSAPCLHSLVHWQVTPSHCLPPRLIGAGLAAASVAQILLEVYAADDYCEHAEDELGLEPATAA